MEAEAKGEKGRREEGKSPDAAKTLSVAQQPVVGQGARVLRGVR